MAVAYGNLVGRGVATPVRGVEPKEQDVQGQEVKKNFKNFWVYVIVALVVGLMIPDKMNPYNIILGLFDKKKTTDEDDKKGNKVNKTE